MYFLHNKIISKEDGTYNNEFYKTTASLDTWSQNKFKTTVQKSVSVIRFRGPEHICTAPKGIKENSVPLGRCGVYISLLDGQSNYPAYWRYRLIICDRYPTFKSVPLSKEHHIICRRYCRLSKCIWLWARIRELEKQYKGFLSTGLFVSLKLNLSFTYKDPWDSLSFANLIWHPFDRFSLDMLCSTAGCLIYNCLTASTCN